MVKIVIDSAADIAKAEADALGVELVPMRVRFGSEEFSDGVDLTHEGFFERLIESDELPQTSQISEFCWEEKFGELLETADELVVITISSKLSGTYDCAATAASKFAGRVYAVDSLNACIGERVLIQYAVRLAASGLSAREIAAKLDGKKGKIQLLALLDTLHYLKLGGRISAAAAFAGGILSIKPVVSIMDGEVKLVGKAMGSKRGNNLLVQLVSRCGGIDFGMPFALGYSGLDATILNKYIEDSAPLWKGKTDALPVYPIGSTIGTHVGPGAIAVAFFSE